MSSIIQPFFKHLTESLEERYLVGHSELLELFLIAYLSRGHILIEGPPGTAKTLTAKLLAALLAKSFKRIQFTTDMLPSDILGAHLYMPGQQKFEFLPGPVFSEFIVADEINRTPPRTQSALLEAMEERQVTIEGKTFLLKPDFFVVATQNPFDYEGTFPLPEVQMDRFIFKVVLSHGSPKVEAQVFKGILEGKLPPDLSAIKPMSMDRSLIEKEVNQVAVDDALLGYISSILAATRSHPLLVSGSSIRGGISLLKGSRFLAALMGRSFVTPDDIKKLVLPSLRHRVRLSPEAQMTVASTDPVLLDIVEKVEFPK